MVGGRHFEGAWNARILRRESRGALRGGGAGAWAAEYGDKQRPDFFTVQGYDAMAAVVHLVKTLDGKIDGDKALAALKGWKHARPRGPISIDPETRDIVQNIYVQKVVKKGDRVGIEAIDTIANVKDPCKALAVGRCAGK